MKRLSIFISLTIYAFFSFSASAQDMPPGVVVRTLNCALNPGVSMAEVVAWGRSLPRDENSANQVFFREALHHSNDFETNYDFQIAWYHGSWTEYISNTEGSRGGSPAFLGLQRPQDLMTCAASDAVVLSRGIPDNDGFTGDETLMMTRFCSLEEGKTIADAYEFAAGVAANFRRAGNNSLMQVNTRSIGPVANRTGTAVVLAEVAATPESMAERLELTRNGLNPTAGLDGPFTICNFPAMWRTYAIVRPPQ